MREIKFRAIFKKGDQYTFQNWGYGERGFTSPGYISGWDHVGDVQYTGLKDKNGKEIYEGDIVKVVDRKIGIVREGERGLVEWQGCGFFCRSLPPDNWDPMSPCFNPMLAPIIVIGNIYENPELCKTTQ